MFDFTNIGNSQEDDDDDDGRELYYKKPKRTPGRDLTLDHQVAEAAVARRQ